MTLDGTNNSEQPMLNSIVYTGHFLVKILKLEYSRALQPDFDKEKQEEVDGLIKRNFLTKFGRDSVSQHANLVGGRFLLTLKTFRMPGECGRVNYFAQGYD